MPTDEMDPSPWLVEPLPGSAGPLEAPTHLDPVLRITDWSSNAEMIRDVARLGYLDPEWVCFDPTWGRGAWWSSWRPERLFASDLNPQKSPGPPVDYRSTPFPDGAFDAVIFDPDYQSPGGRRTSTVQSMLDAYGILDGSRTPAENQQKINDGLSEAARLVTSRGIILVKCQNYITSGKLWQAVHRTVSHADGLGLAQVDQFEHLSGTGPQPLYNADGSPRRQVHARANGSTLLVFRNAGRRRGRAVYADYERPQELPAAA